jgi:hypothetical protein
MNLRFEIGSESDPSGHALVYFTSNSGSEVYGTYVLVLPISLNLEKYVPPMFAQMMPSGEMGSDTAAPMPPVAEEVPGIDWLRNLAAARRDDLVDAGPLYSTDPANLLAMTQQAAADYGSLYHAKCQTVETVEDSHQGEQYGELTEAERLAEMTKVVGRMRDHSGTPEGEEAEGDLVRLATGMPSKYRASEIVAPAKIPGERGQQLATLHLQRMYKLLNEEYLDVADIERQIKELQGI